MEDMSEQIKVTLPKGAWNQIVAIIWKSATCEVGYPIVEALRAQLEPTSATRNGRRANISQVEDDS